MPVLASMARAMLSMYNLMSLQFDGVAACLIFLFDVTNFAVLISLRSLPAAAARVFVSVAADIAAAALFFSAVARLAFSDKAAIDSVGVLHSAIVLVAFSADFLQLPKAFLHFANHWVASNDFFLIMQSSELIDAALSLTFPSSSQQSQAFDPFSILLLHLSVKSA